MHSDVGVELYSGFSFVFTSVNRSDHHAHSFHGVEASAVVRPEDAVLELVTIHAAGVPHSIEIGLATCIVPPATFMEVSAVSCSEVRQDKKRKNEDRFYFVLEYCSFAQWQEKPITYSTPEVAGIRQGHVEGGLFGLNYLFFSKETLHEASEALQTSLMRPCDVIHCSTLIVIDKYSISAYYLISQPAISEAHNNLKQ